MVPQKTLIKRAALIVVGIVGIYIVGSTLIYRIPAAGDPEYIEGRVLYKLDDDTGTIRQFYEQLVMGNHIIRLEDGTVWYVSTQDRTLLWPEDPEVMRDKGYTIKTRLEVNELLFGGYSTAKIIELDILSEEPMISQ